MKRLRNAHCLNRYRILVLTDDLFTGCPLHKYVNDTTLSELVQPKQLDTHILTYSADLGSLGRRHDFRPVWANICGENSAQSAEKKLRLPTHDVSFPTLDLIRWVG